MVYKEINEFVSNIQSVSAMKESFVAECKKTDTRISTGILSVDIALNGGFTDELYIVAGETSTGKSTLLMTLAQNTAEQKVNTLYFSLEMGAKEHIARGISQLSYIEALHNKQYKGLTAGDILYWFLNEQTQTFEKMAYSTYSSYSDEYFGSRSEKLYIIEPKFGGFTASDIANIATLFKKTHPDEKIIVFVDYLQIIRPNTKDLSQADRKTKTDIAVNTLKTLASQVGMPVVTCSSVPKTEYGHKISTSSFKESGDIEYTGGILIGWNWTGVTDQKNEEEKMREVADCKKRGYRKMTFDVLKYRNAQRDNAVKLIYYPAYNYLIGEYDWRHMFGNDDKDNPFDNWDSSSSVKTKPRKKLG